MLPVAWTSGSITPRGYAVMNRSDDPETIRGIGHLEVRPLRHEHEPRIDAAMGEREMWSRFFPFLFFYNAPSRQILIAEAGEALFVFLHRRPRHRRGERIDLFYPPLGCKGPTFTEGLEEMIAAANEANGDSSARVLWAERSDAEEARRVGLIPQHNEWEFIYDLAEVAAMDGKRFRDVRKRFFRFLREYPLAIYRPMGAGDMAGCRTLVRALERKQRAAGIPVLDTGYTLAALKWHTRFPEPKLLARVLVLGERVIGFAMAGGMTQSGANFFILKTDHSVTGAAEYLRCRMMDELYSLGYRWINDAGDLGRPGLRRHKEKFRPVRKLEVCRLLQPPSR
ncbi:MAG: DUF2156 domain-containing protein [Deltaproteobacteria bacterium]|nr:MAG: DUF2156 domain-containing protein [Deltaproteobacteria bacterium]